MTYYHLAIFSSLLTQSVAYADDASVSGAIRYNATYQTWDNAQAQQDRLGDLKLDVFRLGFDTTHGDLSASVQYRWYAGAYGSFLHHATIGYRASDDWQWLLGMSQVPFGIQPYSSHSWFFNTGFYVGLEDDHDVGVQAIWTPGVMDIKMAMYKNAESAGFGSTIASARYAYDVVPTTTAELGYAGLTTDRFNQETNQANLRVAVPVTFSSGAIIELGVSGQAGQIHNGQTGDFGWHAAGGPHIDANFGAINAQVYGYYKHYDLANPEGVDNSFVVMGAFNAPYMVAATTLVTGANIAKKWTLSGQSVDSVTVYFDYSNVIKLSDPTDEQWDDTHSYIPGVSVGAGPLFCYLDAAMSKHHPWISDDYGNGLAQATGSDDLQMRLNLNMGYYF